MGTSDIRNAEPVRTFDWAEYDELGRAVVTATAEAMDADPAEMEPLYDAVDPDALDSLFADSEGAAQVTFRVCRLEVLIRSDGRVRIVDESVANEE